MNKITFILIIAIIFGACSNKTNKNQSSNNDSTIVQNNPDETQKSINNTLNYFIDKKLPISGHDVIYIEGAKLLPKTYNSLFGIPANNEIYACYKFKIYEKYTGLLLSVSNNENTSDIKLYVINKNGKIISKTSLKSYEEIHSTIDFFIKMDYIIESYHYDQGSYGIYEPNNGCAIYMTASEPVETYEDMYEIMSNGKIALLDTYASLHCVENYLENLSDGNLKEAFNLQKNKKWGNFEDFSSEKAFGGINHITTNEIKYISGDNTKAKIYCDATYYDSKNGDSDIKQNFILSKISGKWYITDMKAISFSKRRNYTDSKGELKYLDLRLTNISSENFDFYIEAVSEKKCDNPEDGNLYVEISGKAEYTAYNQAVYTDGNCSLYFFFGENDKELTLKASNYANKYKNLNIILDKDFQIQTFK